MYISCVISDRFLGHPMSIDTLLKLDEDTLISGSEDGVIRFPDELFEPESCTRRKKLDKGKSSKTSAADFFADL
ncbi:hypothetical protein BHE74_00031704 [Ensete ventricosum]|nr:hypothetical protein GW17_00026134 [Ensete ventricosum]RWW61245.1 hypothetical protein BHE74_00031704 [Ensete ventricosum]RZS21349.1 hypothetical protein BHM03_00053977 [Ensete ventricosum]